MKNLAQRNTWLHLMPQYAPKHKQKKRYPNPLPKRRNKTRPKKSKLTMKNLLLKRLLPTLQRQLLKKMLKETSKLLRQPLMLRVSLKRRRKPNPEARDVVNSLRVNAADATEIEVAVAVVAEVEEAVEETTTEDHPLTRMASRLQERSPRLSPVTEITKVVVTDVTMAATKTTTAELEKVNVVEEDPKLLNPELRGITTKLMKAKLRSEPRAFQKHLNKKNKLKSEIPTKIVQQNALKIHIDAICGQRVVY